MKHFFKSSTNDLATGSIGPLLLSFAIPSVISILVNSIYNIIDQIFIGQGVGYLGITATSICMPIFTIYNAVGGCIGTGGSTYASIRRGEKKNSLANDSLGCVIFWEGFIGLIIAVIGNLFLIPMLELLGASQDSLPFCMAYARILLVGAPFSLISTGLSNMAKSDGSPSVAMYSILVGAILNCILDPLFIFVFDWGVTGAAIATTTAMVLSCIILFAYFYKKSSMKISIGSIRPSLGIAKQLLILGSSVLLTQLAVTLKQIFLNQSLSYYGSLSTIGSDIAISAIGIVLKADGVLLGICMGIATSCQPIIGFNLGAGNLKRIRKTFFMTAFASILCSTTAWAIMMLFPKQIILLFGNHSETFLAFAIKAQRIFMMGSLFFGLQMAVTNYFQAVAKPGRSILLSLCRQLLFMVPPLLILPRLYGLDGILYVGPSADLLTFFLSLALIIPQIRKLNGEINAMYETHTRKMV